MRFQISTLLPLLVATSVIALPLKSSSLSARAFTAAEQDECPNVQRLAQEAHGIPVTNGLYWTNDAAACYAKYAEKHKLTVLRDLWTSRQVDIWNDNDREEHCFSRLSQAFALSTTGEVVMVTAPADIKEKGMHWVHEDRHWLHDELPILTDPKRGHKVTKITRVNLKKVAGKKGPHLCEEISSEVIWKEGDAVYHPPAKRSSSP